MRRCTLLLTSLLPLLVNEAGAQKPATWSMSARPQVEIGAVEDDPDYELFQARSALKLDNGRIVVLNAGSFEIRFYDSRGKFLHKTGAKGKLPGEYSFPVKLYYTARDSIVVYEVFSERETHLDTQGRLAGTHTTAELKSPFTRDAWLYGRTFVDGPANTSERARVRTALQQLPPVPPGQYQHVIVDPWYRLWVREPRGTGQPQQRWTIYTDQGRPLATLNTPALFELYQIGPDFLLGRTRNELDVEFIQLYALTTPGTRTTGDYFTPVAPAVSAPPPTTANPDLLTALREYVRSIASKQEIYYSDPASKYRYSADVKKLGMPEDKNITAHIFFAHDRGWGVLATHRDSNVMCGMSMGFGGPLGWKSGIALCGEPAGK